MRLLNIKTGLIVFKEFKEIKNKYIAISHRWSKNEIELIDLGLSYISKEINVGKYLFDKLKKDLKQNQKNNENIEKIINNKSKRFKNKHILELLHKFKK